MTEFGAVDVNALRDGRMETFHGVDCSEDTFRQFREWLDPRMPVVFVSDNPAYDFQWINFYFWRYFGQNPFGHSGRRIADYYALGGLRRSRSPSMAVNRVNWDSADCRRLKTPYNAFGQHWQSANCPSRNLC